MAYREPTENCAECELRREKLAATLPFAEEHQRRCPACRSDSARLKWSIVCVGRSRLVEEETGHWWWKKTKFKECKIGTFHFHMVCWTCKHEWLMRTAYDAVPVVDPAVKKLEEQTQQLIDLAVKREAAADMKAKRG